MDAIRINASKWLTVDDPVEEESMVEEKRSAAEENQTAKAAE